MKRSREDYEGDVIYEVWRRRGNPDAVDRRDLDDYHHQGLFPDEAAFNELRKQMPRKYEHE